MFVCTRYRTVQPYHMTPYSKCANVPTRVPYIHIALELTNCVTSFGPRELAVLALLLKISFSILFYSLHVCILFTGKILGLGLVQIFCNLVVSMMDRPTVGVFVTLVESARGMEIGPKLMKRLDNVEVAAVGRMLQRRTFMRTVLVVYLCSLFDQKAHHFFVPVRCSFVQWGLVVIEIVNVGPVFDGLFSGLPIVVMGGPPEAFQFGNI